MSMFDDFQSRHEQLLLKWQDGNVNVKEVQEYIASVKHGANLVPNAREREQLRANLRFWAQYVFDKEGEYPNTELAPSKLNQPEASGHLPLRIVIGALATIVIVLASLIWNRGLSNDPQATVAINVTVRASATSSISSVTPSNTLEATSTSRPTQTQTPTSAPTITATSTRVSGLSVTLADPRDGDQVYPVTTLSGNYVNLREAWTIHPLLQPISQGGVFYSSSGFFTVPTGTTSGVWSADVEFGDENSLDKPEQYNIVIVVANNQASRDFLDEHTEDGFTQIPSDLIVFSDVTTVLRPAYESMASDQLLYSRFLPPNYTSLDIFMSRLDGADENRLTFSETSSLLFPSLSPDGKHIVYVEYAPSGDTTNPGLSPYVALWVASSNGRDASRVMGSELFGYERPVWSPNGRYIAFSAFIEDEKQIFLFDTQLGGATQLTHDQTGARFPSWLHDGKGLVYNRGNTGLFLLDIPDMSDLSGLEGSKLLDSPLVDETHPAVSPDGQKVAFTAASAGNNREIRLLDLETRTFMSLTSGGNHQFPSWSPDGQIIYFQEGFGEGGIWSVNVDGTNLERVNIENFPAALHPYAGYVETFIQLEP